MSQHTTGKRVTLAATASLLMVLHGAPARSQSRAPAFQPPKASAVPPTLLPTAAQAGGLSAEEDSEPEGFVMPAGTEVISPFTLSGYVDAGYAKASGNGTSFPAADTRLPVDYGVDPFAPAVNTRGDVASTDTGGRFANGFLPRSVNIGGRGSFLLNIVNLDLKYQSSQAPVMIFTRLQFLPRWGGEGEGNNTRVLVEQAFGRFTPFAGREVLLSLGKFDSVFGIEYLDNQSPIRVGVTPSLLARYTTGTSTGARLTARAHSAKLWSALSFNGSVTNSGSYIEALKPPDASLTGAPVAAARIGYELNLPSVQFKLGGSGLVGSRNDQYDRSTKLTMWGGDARLYFAGLSLAGEYVHLDEDEGSGRKETGLGGFPIASGFHVRGFWSQLSYTLPFDWQALRVTFYGRYGQRHAWFQGFRPLTVDRITAGLRLDLWRDVILKAEVLLNRERLGAPDVPNDVLAASAVFSW